MNNHIIIKGAYENNLKHIDVSIPKGKLVVFTGVSGSGKSSLVFDTIAAESMHQLNNIFPLYIRNRMPHYEVPKVESIDLLTTAIVIDQRQFTGDFRSTVATMTDVAPLLRLLFSRCASPHVGSSAAYSNNDPQGMCPTCSGLGKTIQFDFDKVFDRSKSLNEGAICFPGHQVGSYQWQLYANSGLLDPAKPLSAYTEKEWFHFLHGSGITVNIQSKKGNVWESYRLTYEGMEDRITRLYLKRDLNTLSNANQRIVKEYTKEQLCPSCQGAGLNETALSSKLCGYTIFEMESLEIADLIPLLDQVSDPIGIPTVQKIQQVLHCIAHMGLGYLQLNRPSKTLSGGEAQRLKMVRHLGSSLVGITYIFDEPSIGLHPKDVNRLGHLLLHLRNRGNTILVVEHDKDIIRIADEIIDMGPRAGQYGGQIVFQGTIDALLLQDTLTAANLKKQIPVNLHPRTPSAFLCIQNATLHNLKNVTVRIPKHAFTVVSGLAGSGKSSLICGAFQKQYPEAVHISQSPIGTSSRSTPATYLGIMNEIRKCIALENGVDAGLFSYNSSGACPVCEGRGSIKTEMAFMNPITVPCDACQGSRYHENALQYRLHDKNILEIMQMTITEALDFFQQPKIHAKLKTLSHVGMGYVTLGQPTSTLSGGECQRLKLAAYLQTKNGIYILDEPTTGLHGADIALLMTLLQQMVEHNNTVVVVEHDLDVIRQADWVIDMGPEGGKNGGEVLFSGTPEQLLMCPASITAQYLRQDLNR